MRCSFSDFEFGDYFLKPLLKIFFESSILSNNFCLKLEISLTYFLYFKNNYLKQFSNNNQK